MATFRSTFLYCKTFCLIILLSINYGCYITSHRGPWTVKPGSISPSVNYIWFKNTAAGKNEDPLELVGFEARHGISRGMDIGYMRTKDISSYIDDDTDGADMHIFDIKYQFLNTNKLDASVQCLWGNMINLENDDQDNYWLNMLILSVGSEFSSARFFGNFSLEYLDDQWHPLPKWIIENENDQNLIDLTKQVTFGIEVPTKIGLYPVLVFGRQFNDEFGVGNNMMNIGLNYYTNRE